MLTAVKQQESARSNIIQFQFVPSALEEYLKNYDIRHQIFDYSGTLTPLDVIKLRMYRDDHYEYAARLTAEDEIVFHTFDHIEEIDDFLKSYSKK